MKASYVKFETYESRSARILFDERHPYHIKRRVHKTSAFIGNYRNSVVLTRGIFKTHIIRLWKLSLLGKQITLKAELPKSKCEHKCLYLMYRMIIWGSK